MAMETWGQGWSGGAVWVLSGDTLRVHVKRVIIFAGCQSCCASHWRFGLTCLSAHENFDFCLFLKYLEVTWEIEVGFIRTRWSYVC